MARSVAREVPAPGIVTERSSSRLRRNRTGHNSAHWHTDAGETVEIAWVNRGYIGDEPQAAAEAEGVVVHVVKRPEGDKGFILLPRR